jgi:diguanylate cyclase (GGDEF)-like protein/PAS domain S-box-containing protein
MNTLRSDSSSLFRPGFLAVQAILFAAVTFTAWVALVVDSEANGSAAVWWPNAILLAALLLNHRKRWIAILVTGYTANVLSHLLYHEYVGVSLVLSACDLLEVVIAAYPFARNADDVINFSQPRELARLYLFGAIIGPAVSAFLGTVMFSLLKEPVPYHFAIYWFASNALSTIAITPLILSFFDRETYTIFKRQRLLESVGLLLLMALCAALILRQSQFPILFLLFPPLLLIVVRLGMGGGMLGVSIIAAFAITFALKGHGPMHLIRGVVWQQQLFFAQVLIASLVLGVALVAVVINERRKLEQAARQSEQLYRLLAENSHDIIVLTNLEHKRQYISPAVQWTMGWDPKELLGTTFQESVVHPDDIPAMRGALDALKSGEQAKTFAYRCQKKDGTYLWMEANISLYCDRVTGHPIGYVNVVRNIAERKAAEQQLHDAYLALETLATVDALTGIANRRRFDEVLGNEWRRAARSQLPLSLLLLDVDHFKLYNDLYGHLQGDDCLRQITAAALEVIHRPGDTVARFGGEEFGIVLSNTDRETALKLAEKIRLAVAGRAVKHQANPPGVITISVGCSTCIPGHHGNMLNLIEAADQALYKAKHSGRNCVIFSACELPGE